MYPDLSRTLKNPFTGLTSDLTCLCSEGQTASQCQPVLGVSLVPKSQHRGRRLGNIYRFSLQALARMQRASGL